MNKLKLDFLKVPTEFFEIEELAWSEKFVLALYKYYSNGSYKCCTLTNQDVADFFHIDRRSVIRIKNRLKELGYIRTDESGKKTFYVGVKGDTDVTPLPVTQMSLPSDTDVTPKVTQMSLINVKEEKEYKEKKEFNKESDTNRTNFDLLLGKLPDEYMTEEWVSYIYDNVSREKIDNFNSLKLSEYVSFDNYLIPIKSLIQKRKNELEYIKEQQQKAGNINRYQGVFEY